MASAKETPSTSWADETDEVETSPKAQSSSTNAWAKGNPYGIRPPSIDEHSYDRDFPSKNQEPSKGERERAPAYPAREERGYSRNDNERDRERPNSYHRGPRDDGPRDNYRRDRPPREDGGGYHRGPREDRPYRDRPPREDRPPRDTEDRDRDREGRDGGRDFHRDGRDNRDRDNREGRDNRDRDNRDRERRPRAPVPLPTSPPYTAFVGNLPYEATKEELARFFERECKVTGVRLLFDKQTNRPKGFGYVEFDDLESLKKALSLSGESIMDRPIRVDVAEAKPEVERRDTWKGGERGERGERRERRFSNAEASPEGGNDGEERKRPALDLKPRASTSSSSPEATPSQSDAYSKAKINPFGDAKPRDENAILKKKEDERKAREVPGEDSSKNDEEKEKEGEHKEEEKPIKDSPQRRDSDSQRDHKDRDNRGDHRDNSHFRDRDNRDRRDHRDRDSDGGHRDRDGGGRGGRGGRRDDREIYRAPRREDDGQRERGFGRGSGSFRRGDGRRDGHDNRTDRRPEERPRRDSFGKKDKDLPQKPEKPAEVTSANIFAALVDDE